MRQLLRPLYRALLSEGVRARLRPLAYPFESACRAIVWHEAHGQVVSGPFAGLRLAPRPFLPHLLGTYERELHAVIESLCDRPWRKIVNVGGGNGFYIAGLGRRIAAAELIVFELSAEAREVITATLVRNGLASHARVLAAADSAGFEAACAGEGPTLVVMDVEGAEMELTDPALVPSLRQVTILVETHDLFRPGCRATVASRLAGTHTLRAIPTETRGARDFPATVAPWLQRLAPAWCLAAVQEWRGGPQEWLLLEPRSHA